MGGGNFTVTATTEADTKTVLDDVNKVIYWAPGDKISLFDANGAEVAFSTNLTEKATTAEFTNDAAFAEPTSLVAAYPYRGAMAYADGVVNNFRIAGSQTAVAGSFDPVYGSALGLPAEAGSTELKFKNVHCLVKFTVGGTVAPSKVVLKNNGDRMIAGLFHYNTANNTISQGGGAKEITLNGVFEIGKTYYISMIPGICGNGISLYFNDVLVKNTGETVTLEANKIYNVGTLQLPDDVVPVEKVEATLVRALQSESTSYMVDLVGGTANTDRNMTMDGEYIYIAETQGNPVLWKISIADGTAVKVPVGTVDGGGTFALACPRIIKNTDAGINGGKDVLAVCNMGQGTAVYLYLYTNGTEADPVKISMHFRDLSRRLGDQFSVSGTLQSGYVWFKEQGSNAVMLNQLAITSETLANYQANGIWPERVMLEGSDVARGALYFYPGADWSNALYTSTGASAYVTRNESVVTQGKPTYQVNTDFTADYTGCHGFNFFKYNGKDYIAYVSFADATLYIIEGASDVAGVKAALTAKRVAFEAKIKHINCGTTSGASGADCMVYSKDGKTYIAGHVQNVGVVVYELK